MWAPHLVIHGSVNPPSRRAGGSVTARLFVCLCGHRPGRAPWPGPHRGPAGQAAGPPARSVRAEPSAGGYGSAALFLTSGRPPHPGSRWRSAWPWWPGSLENGTNPGRRGASPKGACPVECRRGAIPHPKVLPSRLGAVPGDQAQLPARAAASVRLAAAFASSVGSQNSGDGASCSGSGWEEGQRGDNDDGADDHSGHPRDRQVGIGRVSGNSGRDPVEGGSGWHAEDPAEQGGD